MFPGLYGISDLKWAIRIHFTISNDWAMGWNTKKKVDRAFF